MDRILSTGVPSLCVRKFVVIAGADVYSTRTISLSVEEERLAEMGWYISALRRSVDFSGRARRREFWYFQLFTFLLALALTLIFEVVGFAVGLNEKDAANLAELPSYLLLLAIFLPGLGVTIRRLHDIGWSGRWVFLSFIPFIGGLIILIACLGDSQPGTNKYGGNPKVPLYPGVAK